MSEKLTLEEAIKLAYKVRIGDWNHRRGGGYINYISLGTSFASRYEEVRPHHRYFGRIEEFYVTLNQMGANTWDVLKYPEPNDRREHSKAYKENWDVLGSPNPRCFLPELVTDYSIQITLQGSTLLATYRELRIPELYDLCLSIATKIENDKQAQHQAILDKVRKIITT